MIRVSIFTWIAVSIFVAALMLLPKPYNWLLWIPYGIALPLAIIRWNRRQMEIRNEARDGVRNCNRGLFFLLVVLRLFDSP